MASVNKVLLLGNLGKDPELKYSAAQLPIVTFSVATNEREKDASGQWVDKAEWHNIVAFGKTAEQCHQYLKKGRTAFIDGKIRTRKWQDKEGKDRYTTEIVANSVQFVGGARGAESGMPQSGGMMPEMMAGGGAAAAPMGMQMAAPSAVNAGAGVAAPAAPFDEDDIPF